MLLQKEHFIKKYSGSKISPQQILDMPERVIQFGTGVLLRGLPDFFIDRANKAGDFNGRIVVVKTTGSDAGSDFHNQNNLYTHIIKGYADGQAVNETIINASVSTVMHAATDWVAILEKSGKAEINILISNTTEQGLVYTDEDLTAEAPKSFPGKLLVYLMKRFEILGDVPESRMIVIPTELLEYNGALLKEILNKHTEKHQVGRAFCDWMEKRVIFCNSLVDRIVPGKPDKEILQSYWEELGYQDELLIVSEPYNLWAIEGGPEIREILTFAKGNEGIKITDNIALYKELKLRLLNAAHTFSAGVALMQNLETVTESMQDSNFEAFISQLTKDISASIALEIDEGVKEKFASAVLDRFRNPNIRHYWKSIIFSYTEKFKIRCIPLMKEYYRKYRKFPESMVQGLAAYFSVSIPAMATSEGYIAEVGNLKIKLNDPFSDKIYHSKISNGDIETINEYIAKYFLENEDQEMIKELQNVCVDFYQQSSKA